MLLYNGILRKKNKIYKAKLENWIKFYEFFTIQHMKKKNGRISLQRTMPFF